LELAQYYYAAAVGTLVGIDAATSEIIRVRPTAELSVELENTRTIVVGKFLHFDPAKRLLTTESGTTIHLPPTNAEKSRTLKETTKAWLAGLSISFKITPECK
jgi:hypothetical protein